MTGDPRDWIGRTTARHDVVSDRLVREFKATLSPHLAQAEVPLGLFWCLAPEALPGRDLGEDGHPRLGIVLPDLPFPQRMWAGGRVEPHIPLKANAAVVRESRITDVALKDGKTGPLCFVTLAHTYRGADEELLLTERQDIVYKSPAKVQASSPPAPAVEPLATWTITPTSTMLFRYSALTFNGHRIHYDAPYAREREGYVDLVVHGPLQATLMLNLLATHLGAPPAAFDYRGVSPLTLGAPFTVEAFEEEGALRARVVASDGRLTFSARAVP